MIPRRLHWGGIGCASIPNTCWRLSSAKRIATSGGNRLKPGDEDAISQPWAGV